MKTIYKKMLVAGAAMALAGVAQAQSAGSNMVSFGWMRIMPTGHSEFLTVDSIGGMPLGVQKPNTGATIDSADTLGLTFAHYFTDNISAEFVFGVPPKHNVSGDRGYEKYGKLGEVRQWSPAVVAKWHFFDAKTKFRPFLGLGVNYTWFTDEKVTNQAFIKNEFLGIGTSMSASAKSSWNPVFTAGANYAVTDNWFVGFSVSYVPIATTANFTTTLANGAQIQSHTKIKIDPVVTYLSVGYRF